MKPRLMIFVVVVASACNQTQPSAPSRVPSVQLVTRHFSGVVLTEDGGPVLAATVSFQPSGTPRNEEHTTTDGKVTTVGEMTTDEVNALKAKIGN